MKKLSTSLVLAGLILACGSREVLALAGVLDRPGISIPSIQRNGEFVHDPVALALHGVLAQQNRRYAGGYFVNAFTSLRFRGTADDLSDFLQNLSEVSGAALSIRFSQTMDSADSAHFERTLSRRDFQWRVEHRGWDDPHAVTVTIRLGEQGIDLADLVLPKIRGDQPDQPADALDVHQQASQQ